MAVLVALVEAKHQALNDEGLAPHSTAMVLAQRLLVFGRAEEGDVTRFILLEPVDKNRFKRSQSLHRCSMGKAWFRHGPSSSFSKWSRIPSVGF